MLSEIDQGDFVVHVSGTQGRASFKFKWRLNKLSVSVMNLYLRYLRVATTQDIWEY